MPSRQSSDRREVREASSLGNRERALLRTSRERKNCGIDRDASASAVSFGLAGNGFWVSDLSSGKN